MGRIFGTTGGGRIFGSGSSEATTPEDLLSLAESKGYKPKEKVPVLTRLINLFSAFQPGGEVTTAFRTKKKMLKEGATPTQAKIGGLKEGGKQYISEVTRGLGSVLPFLDEYTKPNELYADREGWTEALQEMYGKPKTKTGKLVQGAAGLFGDIVLDPGNLALAGLFKTLAKGGKIGASTATKVLSKTDKGQELLKFLQGTKDVAKTAFVPAYKASKISPELVDFTKNLRKATNMGDRETTEIINQLINKYGRDVINKLPYEIEKVGISNLDELSPAARDVVNLINEKTAGEVALGLRKANVQDYFPRQVVKDPYSGYTGGTGKLRTTLGGAEKARTFKTLEEGEKAGFKYREGVETLTKRLATSQRSQKAKEALNQLIAGEVKDIDGNPIVKALNKKTGLLEDHVPIFVDKNGIEIAGKKLGFYPEISEAGKNIVAVTTKKPIYQMHKDLAEYLTKANKVFGDDEVTNVVVKTFDLLQGKWKELVTTYFPAFHVRNVVGNIFNNYIGDVKNPTSYLDALKIQTGNGVLPDTFKKIFPEAETFDDVRKILGASGVTQTGQYAEDVLKGLQKSIPDADNLGKFKKAFSSKFFSKGSIQIEDNARIAHYIEKVRKGLSPLEASKSVNKFLFDYSDLTPFERNVMKRIFPFYTFTRKNLELQLEQMAKQPRKYKAIFDIMKAFKSDDLTEDEKKFMPDYIRERFNISLGRSKEGFAQIVAGLGLPIEDLEKLNKPIQSALEMLSPIIKSPTEYATGRSFYYDKDIEDTYQYNSTNEAIANIPVLREWLEAKEVTSDEGQKYYRVNPKKMYLLKAVLGRVITTAEKLSDERQDLVMRALNTLTGVKVYTPDIESEKERQIMEMLKELGLTRTFTKEYVPKDIKEELSR